MHTAKANALRGWTTIALFLALGAALAGLACASHNAGASGNLEAFVRPEGAYSWLIVQNTSGQEISAVRFDPETGVEDFSTQRFFGFDADALLRMTDSGFGNQIPRECKEAARLWQGGFAHLLAAEPQRTVLKRQSEIVALCLDLIGGEHSDGCSRVPDFDFRGCCVNHDICYQSGGSARDRLACDQQLRRCIASQGHAVLAQIYYAGVRAFGRSGFRTR